MGPKQIQTEIKEVSEVVEQALTSEQLLTYQQDLWIDYNALGGLVIDQEDNSLKKMTVDDFADNVVHVAKSTLYNWKKIVPNFWERVAARRKVLGSQARTVKVYNGLFMKAAAGNPQAAAIFLANHDPTFRMPAQKVEHEMGNSWAALLQNKRNAIEGEVVDNGPTKNIAG